MPARAYRRRFSHYAGPLAFLAAVTVAVLLIRSGLNSGATPTTTRTLPSVTHKTTVSRHHRKRHRPKKHGAAQYYVVQSGDTFGTIADKEGTTVARLEQLNPGVSTNALAVGQRLRVK